MLARLIKLGVLVLLVSAIVQSLPDIKRYLRMRRM
jgi:hypothetical protein